MNLKKEVKNRLKDAERLALLCIGSEFRGDDAAGILVANNLKNSLEKSKKERQLKIFLADTAPENFTGEIKKFNPTHLLIVDSADIGKKPGAIALLKPQDLQGISFSTHRLPLTIMINYLLASLNCEIIIIGIQPKILNFNSSVSAEVRESAQLIAEVIESNLSHNN